MTVLALTALILAAAGPPAPAAAPDLLPVERTDRAVVCVESPPATPAAGDSLRARWDAATPFGRFLAGVDRRAELWESNWQKARVPADLLERAQAVGGEWHLLAAAVDGCSDSVSTLPWMGRLAEALPNAELRVLHPDRGGQALMEARPTADGRAATPTVVLLDADFGDAGCFVERPGPLKEWIADERYEEEGLGMYEGKMAWYEQDAGRSTLEEVVALMEAAAGGRPICEG